jgi:uncharacterized Zn finger protein (UPF0148 family)
MIYCCDHCRFLFERTGHVDACPDCGKPSVREAAKEEMAEYLKNRIMREGKTIKIDPNKVSPDDFINPIDISDEK